MGKLIVVSRQKLEAAQRKLKEKMAKDSLWQEEEKENKRSLEEEKARRDAEHASKKAETE